MLIKLYCFGILVNIMTLIFVRVDLQLFKNKYNTEENPFDLRIQVVLADLWTIFIPIYNIINAFYLFYQSNHFKKAILKDLNLPPK